jgi:hypothetical protein
MYRPVVFSCVLGLLLTGCGGDGAPRDDGQPAVTAPTRVEVGNQELALSLYAWRDQMPTVGDEPGPCASLCVKGTVEAVSGGALPSDLEVRDIVAVVDGERLPFEEHELPGFIGPSGYEFVGRRGPVLEVGTRLDVAVLVSVGGTEHWLRGEGVTVERTA